MKAICLFFLSVLPAFDLLPALEIEKPYSWPMSINNGISSTFQEFRSNHFHAGIDLRTFQRTGFPVLAVADGVIERVSVSDRGYGLSLRLRHADGRYSDYGHLEKFRADIQAQVARIQQARGEKYFGTCSLPLPVAVRRGEWIAFSGESGAGFPHLHLEIRDGHDQALNPLSLIFNPPPDGHAPLLKGILLRSRGPTLINGDCGEFYGKLRRQGSVYTLSEPVRFTGPFDLSLHAVDLSDVRHVVAPYSVEAWLDGQSFFQVIFERLSRDDNNQLGMLYDMAYSTLGDYFFNLWHQSGFSLERSAVDLVEKLRQLPPGPHEMRIIVRDSQQNQALAVIPLQKMVDAGFSRLPERSLTELTGNGLMQRVNCSTYVNQDDIVVQARDLPVPASHLRLRITQGGREQIVPARESAAGPYFHFKPLNHVLMMQLRFELSDGRQIVEARQMILQAVLLKKDFAQEIHFRDFTAVFGPTTVIEPKVLLLEQVALRPEFPLLAGPLKSGPIHFAFLDAVFFKFRIPAGETRLEQLGIFKYRPGAKKWSYVASSLEPGSEYVSCRVLTAGTFALLRDTDPPAIRLRRPASRHLRKLNLLVVRVSDRGKGIAERTLAVSVNGRPAEAEYDPDWSHVLIHDLKHLRPGKNQVRVQVSDLAGNRTVNYFTISLK